MSGPALLGSVLALALALALGWLLEPAALAVALALALAAAPAAALAGAAGRRAARPPGLAAPARVIVLVGYAGAGKSSLAAALQKQRGARLYSLADPVKNIVAYACRLDREMLQGDSAAARRAREEPLPAFGGRSARELLQLVGTDCFRDRVSPTVWIDHLAARLRAAGGTAVVTDGRFPNEIDALVAEFGAAVVEVRRGPPPAWEPLAERAAAGDAAAAAELAAALPPGAAHPSAWAWLARRPAVTAVVANDGSLADLAAAADGI